MNDQEGTSCCFAPPLRDSEIVFGVSILTLKRGANEHLRLQRRKNQNEIPQQTPF